MKQRDIQILGIALPSIVSNITVPLLGMIDVAVVGHIGNAVYIGAIAVGSMMFSLIYWIFGFLRMGTSGMTSQALGRRDLTEVTRLLARSLLVALALAAVLVVGQRPLLRLMLLLIHPTADVAPLASAYFHICIWGAPAMLALYGLMGWYVGMQNTRVPMLVSILQNVVNIVASLALVFGFGFGLEGVAAGTVIAQYAGLAAALTLLALRYGRLRKYFVAKGLVARRELSGFFGVNRDIFLRTLFMVGVNLYFTSAGARQGAVILSVNTILMQLYLLFSYVMDGFAYAGEAIGGRYYGAGNGEAFRHTVARLWLWGGAVAALFTLVYGLGGPSFLHLLTDDRQVVAAATPYYLWAALVPLAGVGAFVWDGVFIGVTATRLMLVSAVVSAAVFFSVVTGLEPRLGNHALWLALLVFLALRGLVQTAFYWRRIRNL